MPLAPFVKGPEVYVQFGRWRCWPPWQVSGRRGECADVVGGASGGRRALVAPRLRWGVGGFGRGG